MEGIRLDHIGVVTYHPEEAVEFYEKFLGFSVEKDHNVPGMRLILLKGGGSGIELLCPEKDGLKEGARHIAFKVENIDAVFEKAKKAGYVVYPDKPQEHDNLKFFFIRAPGGEEIELMEEKDA